MRPATREASTAVPGIDALDALRDRLGTANALPDGWAGAVRAALAPLLETEGGPLAEAAGRLLLLADVGDCLAAEGDATTAGLPAFFAEALDRLAAGARSGDPGPAAAWVLRESAAGWGEYLALLDPDSAPEPSWEAPPEPEAAPPIDLAALLRTLTGSPAAEGRPSPTSPLEGEVGRDSDRVGGQASPSRPEPGVASPLSPALPHEGGGGRMKPSAPVEEGGREAAGRGGGASASACVPGRSFPLPHEGGGGQSVGGGSEAAGPAITPHPGPPPQGGRGSDGNHLRDAEPPADPEAVDVVAEARALELDPEIRDVFAADLADLLGRMEELILDLDPDGDGTAAARQMHELGRCYHTLKGAAGSVGLVGLAAEIHALEDRLEDAGGRPSAALCRQLQGSLERLEGVRNVLTGRDPGPGATAATPDAVVAAPDEPQADGLVRVPADRFEELTELGSELLARREAWAAQAEGMRGLAEAARACSYRLRASVDRLCDGAPRAAGGEDLAGLVGRLSEQAEDAAALAAAAREVALPAADEAETLSRLALRLWDTLQAVRVVPVRGLFGRLVRVARDAGRVEGRAVEVELIGEDTVADRVLLDRAYEPLLHLVRNAVGHGIEPPEDRARAGKPTTGRITLEARLEGHAVVIAVGDDGRGLDHDAIAAKGRRLGLIGPDERPGVERLQALIFQPGFSTRGQANAVAGRGVGMDVVAREVERLRGRVELASRPGVGTRVVVRLPARLFLEHVMIVRVGEACYALPTSAIESVRREGEDAAGGADGDTPPPAVDLGAILGIPARPRVPRPTLLVGGTGADRLAFRVDRVEGALEVVVRPLGPLLAGHPVVSGVGLTTGGEILPVLDVGGLLRLARDGRAHPEPPRPRAGRRALVVDDSLSVRRVASRHLRALGLEVDEAADGEQALGQLRLRPYALILTDLEMPRMDGFALLAELARPGADADAGGRVPVVVTSTRSDPETRRRVAALGARGFVPKPVDPEALAEVVGRVLAEAPPSP